MLEHVTQNNARNIRNGILLQLCDLQKVEKSEKIKNKENMKKINSQIYGKGKKPEEIAIFTSEFLGTALLLFMGCTACIPEVDTPRVFHQMYSFGFGFTVLVIVSAFGHISGAHLNPIVTLAAVGMKVMTVKMGLLYVVAQFLGSLAGFGVLQFLMPPEYYHEGFCLTLPGKYMTPMQTMWIELILSAALIIIVCAVWDKRNAHNTDSIPIKFGLVVAGISISISPFTGASLNPTRSFAPALVLWDYRHNWIYWVGPIVGALIGVGIYKYLLALPEDEEEIVEYQSKEDGLCMQDVKSEKV